MENAHEPLLFGALLCGDDGQAYDLMRKPGCLAERNDLGHTPLIVATIYGRSDLIGDMINFGADPNAADHKGWTALHHACDIPFFGSGIARVLLSHGARTDAVTSDGRSALGVALAYPSLEHAELLIRRGARLQAGDAERLPGVVERLRENSLARPQLASTIEAQLLDLRRPSRPTQTSELETGL